MQGMEGRPEKKSGMHFEKTINLGHVFTIITLLGMGATAYTTYRVTVVEHDTRLSTLEKNFLLQMSRNNDITVTIYKMQSDIAVIRDRIERTPPK